MVKKLKSPLVLLLITTFIIMFALNCLTPFLCDDFHFMFNEADGSRIRNLGDIFQSMAQFRLVASNARVVAHAMVQAMLAMPKIFFNILNAFNIIIVCLLWKKYFTSKKPVILISIGLLLTWNFTPTFGQVYLWLDGAVNYSWGGTFFLLFISYFASDYLLINNKHKTVFDILLLPLAFCAGCFSENGSLAAIFVAFCLSVLILLRDKRLHWSLILALIVSCAGYLYLMTAPATAGQTKNFSISEIGYNIRQIIGFARSELLILYIIYASALTLCLHYKAELKKIILSIIFTLGGIGSMASFIFAKYFVERHAFVTVLFTVVAILILLDELLAKDIQIPSKLLLAGLSVLFAFSFVLSSFDIAITYVNSLRREAAIRDALAAGQTSIELPVYTPLTEHNGAYGLKDICDDPSDWPNDSFARYYGFESVIGIDVEK